MSKSRIIKAVIVTLALITGTSSFALADSPADNTRNWTLLAAENHATKGNADKHTVDDPGVMVTSGRTPNN